MGTLTFQYPFSTPVNKTELHLFHYHARRAYTVIYDRTKGYRGKLRRMTLEFHEAVRVLEEYIEILKHDLLFLTAQCKPESMTREISTVKRELDRAIEQRMKLNRIYCSPPLPISS